MSVAEQMCRASISPARQQLGASHMSSGDSWKLCVPTARKQAVLGHCVNLPITHWMLLQGPKPEGRSLPQLTKHSFMFSWEVGDPSLALTDSPFQWCSSSRPHLGENLSRADCCFQDTPWSSDQTKTFTYQLPKATDSNQVGALSADLFPSIQSLSLSLCWEGSLGRQSAPSASAMCEVLCVFHTSLKTGQY